MPQPVSTIVEPRLACRSGRKEDPIECSLHTLPKPLVREFQHVFGDKYLSSNRNGDGDDTMGGVGLSSSMSTSPLEMLAIPTNQHARHDLVAIGDHIEAEKDRLLNCVRILSHYMHSLEDLFQTHLRCFPPTAALLSNEISYTFEK